MKHQKTSLVVAAISLLALGSLISPCHAEILVSYEFTGASAAQTSGSATGTNVTFGAFTGGGAAGTIGFSGSTNSIYARWNATGATATDGDTLAEAITLGNYATFTLTNSTGQAVDLTNLTFDIFFEPYTTGVETSVFVMSDSSGFTDGDQLGGVTYASGTAPGLADTPDTITADLSSLGNLAASDTIEFRLYFVDDSDSNNHLFRVDNVTVNGTVVPSGPDLDPPSWIVGWPQVDGVSANGATARARINEAGTAYYVVVADGAAAPSSAQVKAGVNYGGVTVIDSGSIALSADTENTAAITGLADSTAYDVYFAAEDDETTPNLQTTPVKVDMTTEAPDTTPPAWIATWPQVNGITSTSATARARIDEAGTAYFVVVGDGDTAPDSAEVKAGTGAGGAAVVVSGSIALSADTENTAAITGLTPGTAYDIYFVAEDDATTPNLQTNPAPVIDITTQTTTPTLVFYDFSTNASPTVEGLYTSSTNVTGTGWNNGSGHSTGDGGNYFGRGPTDAAEDSYLTFTVTSETGLTLSLAELSFNYGAQADGNDYLATFSVRTSVDGYTVALPVSFSTNPVASHNGTPIAEQSATLDLSGPLYEGLSSITFRLCAETDEPSSSNQILRWDNIQLTGEAQSTNPGPPTLDSIVDNQGGGPIQVNTRVTYTLTFSETINESTVTSADFANAGTAAVTFGAITETFPGIFTVDVIPTTTGTLQLSIPTTASILDVTGDALVSDPPILDDDTLNVTADTAPPTLAAVDIVDNRDGGPISTGSPVIYTISFNEDIDGATVDAGDFDNAGTSTITFGAITEVFPGVFSVEVTPTVAGTLQLRIPTTATINDLAGFALDSDPAIVDDTTLSVSDLPPVLAVSLNQIGYQTDAPKRFTAVDAPDGTPFTVTSEADPSAVLFNGTITGNLGDFSSFQPASPGPYVVNAYPPATAPLISYPFLIQDDLIESKLVIPCIQFMVDSRSGVGTHPSAYGGNPWRDGTFYSFEIPSLIYLHLNAPGASDATTGELDYDADKALALAPDYASSTFVSTTQDAGFVDALQRYYNDYDPPLPGCPDALKAMHFGLGVTMERPNTKDPSGGPPEHLHAQTREWFAWFLYSWPAIRDHLPDSFYVACRDFTFANWATSAVNQPSPLDIDPNWVPSGDPFKGRHVPGHSILPNLLLWQVALREGRGDANTYLAAAQAQTKWIIDTLDWSVPATTKGHRMSEQKMMTGLVHFLRNHPAEAPAGLAAKIEEWADTMIARSDNLWDFRRYELVDTDLDGVIDWTLPIRGNKWNEPGNLAGFPACALAAAWTLDHAPAKQQRLRELSQSAIDCLFGRNPLNIGSASRPELGFPDQETSWTPSYSGAAGWLEGCRGKLASGPGSEHFPNNPTAVKRWNEGWVNFNAALNMGVSYMLADRSANPQPLAAPFLLVISEILAAPSGNPLAEFVELHNPTDQAVRLEGLVLSGDVSFSVLSGTADLEPGQRCLIVRDLSAFEAVHGTGLPVIGVFTGDLDDNGAALELGDVNGNTFLTVDASGLPRYPGHSSTAGLGGWRLSANMNGSPATSDSATYSGDPSADSDNDGIPDLVNHAVSGIGSPFVAPQFDFSGPGVSVQVTRNLAADDTTLTTQWSTDLEFWEDFTSPQSETPNGDGLVNWIFVLEEPPEHLFIRLQATPETTE